MDFFVASKNLVIELDGLQHETEENKEMIEVNNTNREMQKALMGLFVD